MFKPNRLRRELSVVVLLCTLGVFLFPVGSGPYSAVHGPVTALRAQRDSFATFCSMALAALSYAYLLSALLAGFMSSPQLVMLPAFAPTCAVTVLRC